MKDLKAKVLAKWVTLTPKQQLGLKAAGVLLVVAILVNLVA